MTRLRQLTSCTLGAAWPGADADGPAGTVIVRASIPASSMELSLMVDDGMGPGRDAAAVCGVRPKLNRPRPDAVCADAVDRLPASKAAESNKRVEIRFMYSSRRGRGRTDCQSVLTWGPDGLGIRPTLPH